MPTVKLIKQRVSPKSGVISYKSSNRRGTGTVYFMPNCVTGGIPETIEITGDFLSMDAPPAKTAPADVPPDTTITIAAADAQ